MIIQIDESFGYEEEYVEGKALPNLTFRIKSKDHEGWYLWAGSMSLIPHHSTNGIEIDDFVIAEDYRHNGYGRKAIMLAKETYGANYIKVMIGNKVARHLYQSCGFTEYKRNRIFIYMKG